MPATALFGREHDLAAIEDLFGRARLLTLTGPPGVGKTRLALRAAALLAPRHADGMALVSLASLVEPAWSPPPSRARSALQDGGRTPIEALLVTLEGRDLLLVLDNFEHLVAAADVVSRILAACPRVRILATSRIALNLRDEQIFPVEPLALPDDGATLSLPDLASTPAVALFLDRARAAVPGFALAAANAASVVAICRRLDGLPLAIELAASRVRLLPLPALLALLERQILALEDGPRDLPARQRALRAAITWSYDLLTAEERACFRRLAVFAGGWSPEAAAAVCATPAGDPEGPLPATAMRQLAALANHSLVRLDAAGGTGRYGFLEVVRHYAAELLAGAEEEREVRGRHLAWYLALAERAAEALRGPEQEMWLARLEVEHDNLRAALRWGLGADGANLGGVRLACALSRFWYMRGYLTEGRSWLEGALQRTGGMPDDLRATACAGAAILAQRQGDHARATALLEESLALRRRLGDTGALAAVLNNLGAVAYARADLARARALHEEALAIARDRGDARAVASSLGNLGLVADSGGEYERAAALHRESLSISRGLGDGWSIALSLNNLGVVAAHQGRYEQAAGLHEEALALRRALGGAQGVAASLNNLGSAMRGLGEHERARTLYEESLALRRELGDRAGVANSLHNLGLVAADRSEHERARPLLEEALALYRESGHMAGVSAVTADLGATARALGDRPGAWSRYGECLALQREVREPRGIGALLCGLAALADERGGHEQAAYLAGAAQALRGAPAAPAAPGHEAAWAAGHDAPLDEALGYAAAVIEQGTREPVTG